MAGTGGCPDDPAMGTNLRTATALAIAATLVLGACSGGDDDDSAAEDAPAAAAAGADTDAGGEVDVEAALEAQTPEGTVDVPSPDGALTIADWAAGGSTVEPADPEALVQILAIAGTDADGYITDDAVVIRTTEADATLLCATGERLPSDTYRIVPVLPDGTGVACD